MLNISSKHSQNKWKVSLETQAILLIFSLEHKIYMGWSYKAHIETAKYGEYCEKLPSENDFEAFLATFLLL